MPQGEVILRHAEPVMGTVVSFDLRPQGLPMAATRTALAAACALLHRADETFSLYRPDTPLARFRRGELTVAECPPEVAAVSWLCRRARLISGGWFDPWALPGGFDPTGLVKGWATREAADILAQAGVGAAMVNAGGDIATFGVPARQPGWRIGIRAPQSPGQLSCVIELHDGAVASSGTYERGEHIWDVFAAQPARAVAAASVSGPDLALADALATALVAAGSRGLEAVTAAGYEALIVDTAGERISTAGFPELAAIPA